MAPLLYQHYLSRRPASASPAILLLLAIVYGVPIFWNISLLGTGYRDMQWMGRGLRIMTLNPSAHRGTFLPRTPPRGRRPVIAR